MNKLVIGLVKKNELECLDDIVSNYITVDNLSIYSIAKRSLLFKSLVCFEIDRIIDVSNYVDVCVEIPRSYEVSTEEQKLLLESLVKSFEYLSSHDDFNCFTITRFCELVSSKLGCSTNAIYDLLAEVLDSEDSFVYNFIDGIEGTPSVVKAVACIDMNLADAYRFTEYLAQFNYSYIPFTCENNMECYIIKGDIGLGTFLGEFLSIKYLLLNEKDEVIYYEDRVRCYASKLSRYDFIKAMYSIGNSSLSSEVYDEVSILFDMIDACDLYSVLEQFDAEADVLQAQKFYDILCDGDFEEDLDEDE